MFNFTNTSPYLSNVDDQLLFQKLKTYIDSINQNKEIINQIQLLTQSSSNNQGSLSQLLDNLISRVGEDENKQSLQTIQINQLNQLVSQIQAGILVQVANVDFEFKDDEDKLVALQQSLNQLSQFLTQVNVKVLENQSHIINQDTQITSINSSISALAAKEANDINTLTLQTETNTTNIQTLQSQPQIPIPVPEINTKYLVNKSQASYALQTGVEHKDIVNYQSGVIPGTCMIDNSVSGTKLIDGTVQGTKLVDDSIPGTKLFDATIPISKFDPRIKNQSKVFVTQATTASLDFAQRNFQNPTGIFQQTNWGTTPICSFIGPAYYMPKGTTISNNQDFSFSDNIAATGSVSSFINSNYLTFGGYLSHGMSITYSNNSLSFIGASAFGCMIRGTGQYNSVIRFGTSYNDTPVSYIDAAGNYNVWSDENIKSNIRIKTNYQEQLDKLLKVNVITYSYGAKYQQDLDKIKQQLSLDPSNEELQNQMFETQYLQATCLQGFSYQNLQDSGLDYVWNDRVMDEDYLKQISDGGTDNTDFLKFKEKLEKRFDDNKQKTICQADMIPYLVMGIKALNQKIEDQNSTIERQQKQIDYLISRLAQQ